MTLTTYAVSHKLLMTFYALLMTYDLYDVSGEDGFEPPAPTVHIGIAFQSLNHSTTLYFR